MAYHIGQLRKSPDTIYMWLLSEYEHLPASSQDQLYYGTKYVDAKVIVAPNELNTSDTFYEPAIYFNGTDDEDTSRGRPVYQVFKQNVTYFINFAIKLPQGETGQTSRTYIYDVLLKNDTGTDNKNIIKQEQDNPPQKIGQVLIPTSTSASEYIYYSAVFTPRKDASYLVFRFLRNIVDIDKQNHFISENQGVYTVNENNLQYRDGEFGYGIYGLNNLVTTPTWIRLGYQSRPGNLIVVNKEPIRVGRSGIFQLDKIQVNSFMIAVPKGSLWTTIDPFLLDYAYNS